MFKISFINKRNGITYIASETDLLFRVNKSHLYIINSPGPETDTSTQLNIILRSSLKAEPTFTQCILLFSLLFR